MYVIDTSVWSRALRRQTHGMEESRAAALIRRLVVDNEEIATPGIVLQELLSGLRVEQEFERLSRALDPFDVVLATKEHHLLAARLFNICKAHGLNVSPTDVLIAATAIRCGATLVTSDGDFRRMAEIFALDLLFVE
ncbi:MAG: PIN domain-containing protein [Armatimonadetes bacterium]|nr:PIN domain-containing protein [Armatimonadota bacterium]